MASLGRGGVRGGDEREREAMTSEEAQCWTTMTDMVNHPPHYKAGDLECIDVIEALRLPYHLGNALKYVWRHDHKGGIEDIKKARWYLDRHIHLQDPVPTQTVILLDMDGVCCDFASAAAEVCGHGGEIIKEWNMAHQFGISDGKFWEAVDLCGFDFWRDLQAYPWFPEIYHALKAQGSVYITTTPSQSPHSFAGKIRWLQDRLGRDFRDFIFTPHKHLLTEPGRILIDDNADTCRRFEEHGGRAILFPQPWNDAVPESFGPPWKI